MGLMIQLFNSVQKFSVNCTRYKCVNIKQLFIIISSIIVCGLIIFCDIVSPANQIKLSDGITFETTSQSFSAILTVIGNPKIVWVFDDGTTSSSVIPFKDYGSYGKRLNKLVVTPWSALIGVNIGYDGDDGGPDTIQHLAQQSVTAVYGMDKIAPYLKTWASSHNPLTYLDFSNFVNLTDIECFQCTSLRSINLSNTPLLSRVCFESNALTSLDLSQSPDISDIRGANNQYSTISFGSVGKQIWHLCIHDNHLAQNLPTSQFTSIQELWIWNDSQTGKLAPISTHLTSVIAYGNSYSSADFKGCFPRGVKGEVNISHNSLQQLDISNCPGLLKLNASHNNLDQSSVDNLLQSLDSFGAHDGWVNLFSNQRPSSLGQEYISSLKAKGWKIIVDEGLLLDIFDEILKQD
jgi:hypothetical protein